MSDESTPQSNFQDNQTFNIDIRQMYQDFIVGNSSNQNVGIDNLRSQINTSTVFQSGKSLIDSLRIDDFSSSTSNTSTNNTTIPGQVTQESRCHAFYRIIGFPVVSKDKRFYNPGYDPNISGTIHTINLDDKIKYAENPIDGFEELSKARENWVNSNLKIFAGPQNINVPQAVDNPQSIDTMVFCLTSGSYSGGNTFNLRNFTAPFDNNSKLDPFLTDVIAQSYGGYLNKKSLVHGNVLLADYQDAFGLKPTTALKEHKHIIIPFIVDPRIDFSVYPIDSNTAAGVSRRIAVPFVLDQTYLKISSNSTVERPLLEKILTEKFSVKNQIADSGDATQKIINYVTSFKSIQNTSLLKKINSNDIYNLGQVRAFSQYLFIIQAMMVKLVDALGVIKANQGQYYWLPVPSTTGPEGGCSVNPFILSGSIEIELITTKDWSIINKIVQSILNQQVETSASTTSVSDVGGFALSAFKLPLSADTANSSGDNSSDTLDSLYAERNHILSEANDALQIVEMIMGEFSGLGLCDIIAIMGGLYVMDKDLLLEFLDDDALYRMNTQLKTTLTKNSSLDAAMTELAATVKGFYTIMQQFYEDLSYNNS